MPLRLSLLDSIVHNNMAGLLRSICLKGALANTHTACASIVNMTMPKHTIAASLAEPSKYYES